MYDVDYFINKFEAIPEDKWVVGSFSDGRGGHCANGHCGADSCDVETNETKALGKILMAGITYNYSLTNSMAVYFLDNVGGASPYRIIWTLNDGCNKYYQQPTPKQRILAALYDIKAMQQPVSTSLMKKVDSDRHYWLVNQLTQLKETV